jgi:hypothetical protein
VIPDWLVYLMRKDRSERITELMDKFVDRVCIYKDGWEIRFARKFGAVYGRGRHLTRVLEDTGGPGGRLPSAFNRDRLAPPRHSAWTRISRQ